ncbi:MAG: biotin synthase BioB [Bacteroidia bacterium]
MNDIRYNWTKDEIAEIYNTPLLELVFRAASLHRKYHNPSEVQISSLISIKTGGCPEDCAYCPQSASHQTEVKVHKLMGVDEVSGIADQAKTMGASRLCMGAAWREVRNNKDFDQVLEMVKAVNAKGMEVCATLGMVTEEQALKLADAGLYAYNHNVDTSEENYGNIISTRKYEDRLNTLHNVRKAGLTVCSGGIIGMGESISDRIGMLLTLSHLNPHPESVPINALVPVEGTPLAGMPQIESWEMIRMIATTRIVMADSVVRLSAGRGEMNKETQAFCFMAGANSIFMGEKLLTTPNPDVNEDKKMFEELGLKPRKAFHKEKQGKVEA